jgi:hypothetical protein
MVSKACEAPRIRAGPEDRVDSPPKTVGDLIAIYRCANALHVWIIHRMHGVVQIK